MGRCTANRNAGFDEDAQSAAKVTSWWRMGPRVEVLLVAWFLGGASAATCAAEPPSLRIEIAGETDTVYDWKQDRCGPKETVDAPPRAFRDSHGNIHLFASHDTLRQFVGPSLDSVRYDCRILRKSDLKDAPELYADHQWLVAPYTLDGEHVFGLVHNEFNGHARPALCPSRNYGRCWANSLTLISSQDGGETYQERAPPANLVAALPYPYVGDIGFPVGYFQPSNIVSLDGYYYALIRATRYRDQENGICVMRTNDLADPASWRAWNGSAFSVRFVNPYLEKVESAKEHVCTPLSTGFGNMGGLARDPASGAFFLVATGAVSGGTPDAVFGIVAGASYDLIHWSKPVLVWADPVAPGRLGDPRASDRDPSLLDPTSDSWNFDTIGARPYVYFVRMNVDNGPYDRRLLRTPVRITISPP
jgi:hypothetical protein